MKTYLPKKNEIERKWRIVDAEGQVLGRMAVKIADVLRGKDKPSFTPHLDCGDYVIVINAEKVKLTGRKDERKIYRDYTGHMGGVKEQTAAQVRARKPARLVEDAVWGMLPKGKLGRAQFRKLHVYAGGDYPQQAQKPEKLEI